MLDDDVMVSTERLNPGQAGEVARIGPNAIIRVAEVLPKYVDAVVGQRIFAAAGIAHYWREPPTAMVAETEVSALHQVLRSQLGLATARAVSWQAGLLTGDYLLAHRIPKPAQWLLKRMPGRLASHVLLAAVKKNAWTFVGSGLFTPEPGRPSRVSIAGCCLCRGESVDEPICDFYAASFERLFRVLVNQRVEVKETACQAMGGASACTFEMSW